MAMYLGTDRVLGAYLGSDIYDGMALGSDESTSNYGILRYYDDDPASNSGDWSVGSGFGGGISTNANGITFDQTVSGVCNGSISIPTEIGKTYEFSVTHSSATTATMFLSFEDGDGNSIFTDASFTAGKTTTHEYTATATNFNCVYFLLSGAPVGLYIIESVFLREIS